MRGQTWPQPHLDTSSESVNILTSNGKLATCIALLRSHAHSRALIPGLIVHDHIIKCGHHHVPPVATLILQLFLKCGAFDDALQWFLHIPVRDVLSWNLIIGAFVQQGRYFDALLHYKYMQWDGLLADQVTYVHTLSACTTVDEGVMLYEDIRASGFDCDTIVGTALVSMFGRHKCLDDAQAVFEKITTRNIVSWNAMISAHTHNAQGVKALFFFNQIHQEGVLPDKVTFINMCTAYTGSEACLCECKKLQVYASYGGSMLDNVVVTSLIYAYGKCSYLSNAEALFNQMERRGVVSWNAMITLYAQEMRIYDAFHIFDQMQLEGVLPDNVTFITLLDACAGQAALAHGKRLHLSVLYCDLAFDVVLTTSLVNVYGKCGKIQNARALFDNMKNRNVVSWNAMIAAYAKHGCGREALQLFNQMQGQAIIPNKLTLLEVFSACASQAALATGKKMHSCIVHSLINMDDEVGGTLISMYGKCGNVEDAQAVFDNLHSRKTSSWNALIATYAQLGYANEASQLCGKMNCEGVLTDDITFVSILAACSRGGLLDEGYHYFVSMHGGHAITPTAEHYDCMIDLLCRAGLLEYALYLINNMPSEPTILSWTSLLCAYGIGVEE